MPLEMSCAFATSMKSAEHVRVAEQLGFKRAYLYDSPPLYADVWMQLALAAERTERIIIGPSGLIPSNRAIMTTASAISTLVGMVGQDRVSVAVGTGMSSRLAMGKRPLKWSYVTDYVTALRALLRGEVTEWDDRPIRMLHDNGFATLPIEVEIILAAAGPKGIQAAKDVGDGVFGGMEPVAADFGRHPCLTFGTVLNAGEDPGSPRAIDAAGHFAAVTAHWGLEFGGLDDSFGDAEAWRESYTDVPDGQMHLAVHKSHLVGLNERDRPFIDGRRLSELKLALTPEAWADKLRALEAAGATEVAYQPAGDIVEELERFAKIWPM